jgi:hypothetical protein
MKQLNSAHQHFAAFSTESYQDFEDANIVLDTLADYSAFKAPRIGPLVYPTHPTPRTVRLQSNDVGNHPIVKVDLAQPAPIPVEKHAIHFIYNLQSHGSICKVQGEGEEGTPDQCYSSSHAHISNARRQKELHLPTRVRSIRTAAAADEVENPTPFSLQAKVGPSTQDEPVGVTSDKDSSHEPETSEDEASMPVEQLKFSKYGLFPLVKPEVQPTDSETDVQYDLDIVAVHGLNGKYLRTWEHQGGYCWLRDSLPTDLPGSRIFSFGYPSEVAFSRSAAGVSEFATQLLANMMAMRSTPSVSKSLEFNGGGTTRAKLICTRNLKLGCSVQI